MNVRHRVTSPPRSKPSPASAGVDRSTVLALRIPADPGEQVVLAVLPLTASVLSDAIGGGFLEDALTAVGCR